MATADELFDSASDADKLFDEAESSPAIPPGSPLEVALKAQTGDVVTVDTPTGPAQFTRQGQRFFGPDEAKVMLDSNEPAFRQRVLEGALSLASGGGPMLDELRGAGAAIKSFPDWVMNRGKSPADAYRSRRDETRAQVDRATRNASPTVNIGDTQIPVLPALGAAVPSLMAPNPLTAMGRIASAGAQGATSALGTSTADLTRGEGSRLASDVMLGGGLGLGAGAVGEAMGVPLRALAGASSREAGAAKDAVTAATQAAKDKAAASALGGVGRITSTQGNSMESVMEVLRNPQWFSDDVVQEAYAIANSPEGKLMLSRAATNNMAKLRQSFGAEPAAREALATAQEAAAPSAVAAEVTAKTAPEAIVGDVGSKFMRSVGQRAALGAAGSALGAGAAWLTGGDVGTGAGIGATAGFLPQGALQFARNQAKSPTVQYGANALMSNLLNRGAGVLSHEAAAVTPIAQQVRSVAGPAAQTATSNAYRSLMERFGIAAKSKEQLADEAFLAGQSE